MKEKLDFEKVPYQYPMCLNHQCPKAETCLRQLAVQCAPADIKLWVVISPKLLATVKGDCPHYRSCTKVRYAKGFIKALENLPYKQMQAAISSLMGYFRRRTYYRSRKGERLLTLAEQQCVVNIFTKYGAATPIEFDAYEEDFDW